MANLGTGAASPSGNPELRVFELRGMAVDLTRREFRAHGSIIPIGSRAFEIIEMLIQAGGDIVSKDDLMRRVWPGLIVEDNTVQVHISAIRKAFGADRGMLKTISGRGYRLLGSWTSRHESPLKQPEAIDLTQSSSHPFHNNIPAATSALIGRDMAVQQLRDLLSAYRVVTLAGPGGIGKTVLATEVARRLVPTFEGDVIFIELVSLSDPALVPATVAHGLNLQLHGDEMSPELVARATGGRKVLLVLDNCEHVIDAVAMMAETFLRLCPHATVLATSREVLRIEGEFVYRVPALDVPTEGLERLDDVLLHSAVQLFITRTRSLRADFMPEQDRLPEIAAICRQLDGIPLAIEFAAARAATLGVQQVVGRLNDRFALLTGGRRTALPRHQTLRATLDWSYELLPATERRLLRLLAIFPAGFTLDAATAIASDTGIDITLGISSLVSKSLVTLDGSESARRWRLLETVRAYAFEKLAESAEYVEVVRRLGKFCLALFSPFAQESKLRAAVDDLGRFRREVDNLRAALNWAFSPAGDTVLGIELAATTSDFWIAVSLVSECCEWAEKALKQIRGGAGTRLEMVLQGGLGIALIYTQGMSSYAHDVLMRALAIARRLEDSDYRQRAICGLWLFSARSLAVSDAFAYAREYEEIAQGRDLQSRATAAWLAGVPKTYMAEHVEANERLQWAIENYPIANRRLDMIRLGADPRASAMAHRSVNLLSQGFLDAAVRESDIGVEEARNANQPNVLCASLAWAAGFISLSLGKLDATEEYGEELIGIAYKHGLRPFHAAGLCVKGGLAFRRGEADRGIELLHTGIAEMQASRYLLFCPFFRTELAAALGSAGRLEEALAEIDAVLRFAIETDYRWFVPEVLRIKGELLALCGSEKAALAEELFRESMSQANAQQAAYWELSAAINLAILLRIQHKDVEAYAMLSSVYHRFTEGFDASRMTQAKALLDKLGA